MPSSTVKRSHAQQRVLLSIGLGGLLILLVAVGASAVTFLKKIEGRHEDIRADFISRMRVLEQLRNDVYRSGTRVHDFLLEEDPGAAARERQDVLVSQQHIEMLEDEYARALRTGRARTVRLASARSSRVFPGGDTGARVDACRAPAAG